MKDEDDAGRPRAFPADRIDDTTANAGVGDPATRFARALCVFIRFAIEHRDSAQLLWRLNSGATMAGAPVNRELREELLRAAETRPFAHLDVETGLLLIMGTTIIAIRHVLEERLVTPATQIAANMSAVMLRGLGVAPRRAQIVAKSGGRGHPRKAGIEQVARRVRSDSTPGLWAARIGFSTLLQLAAQRERQIFQH